VKTGSEKGKEPTETRRIEIDEVDPAEFFDPEAFDLALANRALVGISRGPRRVQ
jgi:hypothetical protein